MTDGPLPAVPAVPESGPVAPEGPLPGVLPAGREHGLEMWVGGDGSGTVCWIAPPGTTATVALSGGDRDAAELQWSARCAQVPATRAVVLLGGPAGEDPGAAFTAVHLVAEAVAEHVSAHSRVEAGPIEVLIFRAEATEGPEPFASRPTPTPEGAEFRFRHLGGADVHLTLTIPTPPGEA